MYILIQKNKNMIFLNFIKYMTWFNIKKDMILIISGTETYTKFVAYDVAQKDPNSQQIVVRVILSLKFSSVQPFS